jgi:hypothetical protein
MYIFPIETFYTSLCNCNIVHVIACPRLNIEPAVVGIWTVGFSFHYIIYTPSFGVHVNKGVLMNDMKVCKPKVQAEGFEMSVSHPKLPCLKGTLKKGAWTLLGNKKPNFQIQGNCGLICDFVNKKSKYLISMCRIINLMHNYPPKLQLLKLSAMHL